MSNTKAEQPIFYIYVYLNPLKPGRYTYNNFVTFFYKPFYVGKGQGIRYTQHITETHSTNKHKFYTIQKIKNNNLLPVIIKIITNTTECTAFETEINLIQCIGRADLNNGPLVNMTNGGEGRLGGNNKGSNNPMYGKKHSISTIQKISAARKGSKASLKTIQKLRALDRSNRSYDNSNAITPEANKKRSSTLCTFYQTLDGQQSLTKRSKTSAASYQINVSPTIATKKIAIISHLQNKKFIKGKSPKYYYLKNYPNIRFCLQRATLKCESHIGPDKWGRLWIASVTNITIVNNKLYISKLYTTKASLKLQRFNEAQYSNYFIIDN